MKKEVKLDLLDGKDRNKAIQPFFDIGGIGSLTIDTEDNKLTVSGDFNLVKVVNKLRKSWHIDILSFGPTKEDDGKKDKDKKNEVQVANLVKAYQAYRVPYEETPNCVIC